MIVVFDSGIWISAIACGGIPLAAITYGLNNDDVLTCAELENEVVRIMKKKFGVDSEQTRQRLMELLAKAKRVKVTGTLTGICRDPKDDFLLECAAVGRANAIVTGDKDLLALNPFRKIRILTPRQYLDLQ